jgi:hypothetical protein
MQESGTPYRSVRFHAPHRTVMEVYRKRLLKYMLPIEHHHSRQELDYTTAAKLLACFGPRTWLYQSTVADLLLHWREMSAMCQQHGLILDIGGFATVMLARQLDANLNASRSARNMLPDLPCGPDWADMMEVTDGLSQSLYVAGFIPSRYTLAQM